MTVSDAREYRVTLEFLVRLPASEDPAGLEPSFDGGELRFDPGGSREGWRLVSVQPAAPLPGDPYLFETRTEVARKWNPHYGEDRVCRCGHPYYRHFDGYESPPDPVGCKYCACRTFVEAGPGDPLPEDPDAVGNPSDCGYDEAVRRVTAAAKPYVYLYVPWADTNVPVLKEAAVALFAKARDNRDVTAFSVSPPDADGDVFVG